MREKKLGIWQTYTWANVLEEVRAFSLGLRVLGLKRDDTIALLGDNRPRLYWTFERPTCSKVGKSANLQRNKTTRAIAVREGFGWWPRHNNLARSSVHSTTTTIQCRSCFCAMP